VKHPLHPALVHFPIACWSLATAADLAHAARLGDVTRVADAVGVDGLWRFAFAVLAIGTAVGLATMASGMAELVRLGIGHRAEAAVQRHMTWAIAAWSCYAASLFLRLDGAHAVAPGFAALALGTLGFGCLAVAGWQGGTLVYRHGVGARGT
jgi:uncharacterized membrane protein